MQASIILCLFQARINGEGYGRKGIWHKNGVMMGVGAPIVQMGRCPAVHASASVIFHCTIRSRRWRAIMEEVDKGCSEFCITVGTVTRTASILIHSRLQELAVNLSRLSSRLWLYAGLIGFNHPCWLKANLAVCAESFFFFLTGVSG